MLRQTRQSPNRRQTLKSELSPEKLVEMEHELVVQSLIPRLNETLFEALSEAPFQGQGMIITGAN